MKNKYLKIRLYVCLFFIHFLFFSTNCFAKSGGGSMDGGGGNILFVNNCPVLLDLYLNNPLVAQNDCSPGIQLPNSKVLKSIHLDRIKLQGTQLASQVLEYLEVWRKSSPLIINLIKEGLKNAPIFYTSYQISYKDLNYSIPSSLKELMSAHELKTIAFYSKDLGILISQKDFNQLDKKNQVALIVHEILRHLQITYSFQMSNFSIQKITAAIVNYSPLKNESLDSENYLDGDILKFILPKMHSISLACELQQDALLLINLSKKAEICAIVETGTLSKESNFNIADSLAKTSSQILEYRIVNRKQLNESSLIELGNLEMKLDYLVAKIRSDGINDIYRNVNPSFREVKDGILNVKKSIEVDVAINEAKYGIGWLTGSKQAILKSLNQLVSRGFLTNDK